MQCEAIGLNTLNMRIIYNQYTYHAEIKSIIIIRLIESRAVRSSYAGIKLTLPHHHCGGGAVIDVGGLSGSGPSEAHDGGSQ